MLKPLLAPLLSACLLLVPATAQPARADTEDVAKVLAGIAALYFIGRAIEQRRGEPFEIDLPREWRGGRQDSYRRPVKVLDPACQFWAEQGGVYARAFDKQCLERSVARPELLPVACERRLPADRDMRRTYDARCLERDGWVMAARAN